MEIIANTIDCPFCNCKFTVSKDDIKLDRVFSSVGYYHHNIYKRIYCPMCGEIAREKFVGSD